MAQLEPVNVSPSVLLVDVGKTPSAAIDALRALKFRVETAAGFEAALDRVLLDPPDAIVTELRLGAFNGLHLIMRLRGHCPDVVAVVYTAFPDPVLERQAHQMGATYLIRDGDPSPLVALLADQVTAGAGS